MKKESSVPV